MDFTNAFLTGLISGGVSLAVGLLGIRFLAPRMIRSVFASIPLNEFVNRKANEVINGYLTDLHDHPEKYTSTIVPFLNKLAASVGGEMLSGDSQDGGDPIIRFIPRKWRGLYAIAKGLGVLGSDTKKATDAVATWGQ